MRIIDLLKMGIRNLRRRKARTALTVIGVVIGTISIVVMISIGLGMNANFDAAVMQNGAMTVINVRANSYVEQENGEWQEVKQTLDEKAMEAIRKIDHVKAVSPRVEDYNATMYTGKWQSWGSFIIIDYTYYEDLGFPALQDGTYPTKENWNKVIFGEQTLKSFYKFSGRSYQEKDDVDPAKDQIYIQFNEFETNPKKKPYQYKVTDFGISAGEEYSEYSYSIIIDIENYRNMMKKYSETLKVEDRKKVKSKLNSFNNIIINVDNMNNVTEVQDRIKELGYVSDSDMQWIETQKQTSKMLQMILGAIGGVAMLVSAINIANTMIMSIYERTKEIGIMKVLGCYIRDIKRLFLFEAGMIGLIGSIIGIALSLLASWVINTYGTEIFSSLMDTGFGDQGVGYSLIPFWLPLLAAAFGTLVGIVSGYFPARRATKISAIEAMRTEG
ncbi:MAG: ABC transporter permease [Lachnospiraceae bacterium]|nr:ABC transporter permease [Lachnospiraceae bacterium]